MAAQERPGRYEEQARSYDRTRGASPTVSRLVGKHLGPAEGRRLLDIAGGTGNYAQVLQARGFDVVVSDAEVEMAKRSAPKVGAGRQVVADALALPFGDGSFDVATIVSAIHLLLPQERALAEARRVIRGGPVVIQTYTEENLRTAFVLDYFGGWRPGPESYPPTEEFERRLRASGFARVERETFVYLDTADGTIQALHTDALRLAGPAYLRNTSFFNRLPEHVRVEGLERLADDLRSGVLERRVKEAFQEAVSTGHGTVFAAWP